MPESAIAETTAVSGGLEPSSGILRRELFPTLLAVSPVPPWPPSDGMALRVSRLLRELSERWNIVLICPPGGEPGALHGVPLAAEINIGRAASWMYLPSQYDTVPVVKTVSGAVKNFSPTVALLWGGMEYLRERIPGMPPSVSDRVDCMTLSAWRLLSPGHGYVAMRHQLGHLLYVARYEFRMRTESRATVVVGDADAAVLRRLFRVQNVRVIPNGVDLPANVPVGRALLPTVMFTGVMSYQPNIDAVMYFAEEIWPSVRRCVPDAIFQIVGRSPGPDVLALRSRPGVEVHADVESVQSFLARAWLAVAPMRSGSGIKNKVLEAWSVGTPALMTPIATNGLGGAPIELLLAAEGNELSELIVALLEDGERRTALGALAVRTAQQNFSWRGQGAALHALLENVAARGNREPTEAS